MKTIKVVAVDPGYGAIKVCIDKQTVLLPSAVARIKEIGKADIGMKTLSQAKTILLGWNTYVVGDGAWHWGEPLTNRDYSAINSPERMALIFATIAELLPPGEYLIEVLVIGLPVPLLMDTSQSESVMNGLKTYKGEHSFATPQGKYKLTFQKLKVLAQPVGAYADWLLDDELHIRKNGRQAEVGVLDIGMNTLDLYVIQDGKVLPRFIGGAKVGVRRLLEILDANGHDPEELDAQLRAGRLKPSKEQLDSWLSEILAALERTWPSLRRFTTVIPAGGGSVLLGDALRMALITKGAAVTWPADPGTTNVNGLWKWGMYGK